MTPRTITLQDGRVVEVEVWEDEDGDWFAVGSAGVAMGAAASTEDAAIAALKRKLERQE